MGLADIDVSGDWHTYLRIEAAAWANSEDESGKWSWAVEVNGEVYLVRAVDEIEAVRLALDLVVDDSDATPVW